MIKVRAKVNGAVSALAVGVLVYSKLSKKLKPIIRTCVQIGGLICLAANLAYFIDANLRPIEEESVEIEDDDLEMIDEDI